MFWGMKIKGPKNNLGMMLDKPLRISMIALEPPSPDMPYNEKTEVTFSILDKTETELKVCKLNYDNMNKTVDLLISDWDRVAFRITGEGTLHLSGYFDEEDDDSDSELSGSCTESDEEDETAKEFQGLKIAPSTDGGMKMPDFGASGGFGSK